MKTTIQVNQKTLERLKMFKKHQRESYEEVLNGILDEAEEDDLNSREIEEIKIALDNVKQGKTKSIGQVAKELGIVLK